MLIRGSFHMAKQVRGRAPREEEHVSIIVAGNDAKGDLFQEETQTVDMSESGISFYLKTPIWMDSHLTLKIQFSSLFGVDTVIRGKVVRMQDETSGRKLIGVRLD
jgi:hypothetical protein